MFWLLSEIRIACVYTLYNMRESAAERASFVMQTIGMMLNNSAFVIMWLIFLNVYGSLNGWHAPEIIALNGFNALVYGIAFTLCGGMPPMRDALLNGAYDSVLLTPRALLTRSFTLDMRISALGDVVFGVVCLSIYFYISGAGLTQLAILGVLLVPTFVIMASIMLISSCIAFFIPDSSELSRSFFELVFAPSMYPSGYFQGPVRFFLIYIIPSIAIAGLPVELATHFSLPLFSAVWCIAGVWAFIAWRIFLLGLSRYESGNVTGARL